MQQVFGVFLECSDLFLPQGFLIPNDIFLTLLYLRLGLRPHTLLRALHLLLPKPISLDHLPIEPALLLLADHIIRIIIDILMLLDLLRMLHHHISLQVKLRSIESDVLAFLHRVF